ncbi:MAG: hypothetical protein ACFCBW_10690 [Candidatus Competibacterales bacterium]
MSDFNTRKQALEAKITELESTLANLKEQLRVEEEAAQHAAIDKLEVYLEELNNRNTNLQEFWKILREEIRELFSGTSKPKDN